MATLPERSERAWIQAFGGGKLFPLALWSGDFHIIEVARALSNQCRFGGHVRRFYSVAEHCVRVSLYAERLDYLGYNLGLPGLIHDGGESALPDMCRPVKYTPEMANYREASIRAQEYAYADFGVEIDEYTERLVKLADNFMLGTEAVTLKSPLHPDWRHAWSEVFPGGLPRPMRGMGWSPDRAYVMFLRRFVEVHPRPDRHLTRRQIRALRWPWPIAAELVTRSFVGSRA